MWKIIASGGAIVVLALAAFLLPGFIRARNTSASNGCVQNLHMIDGAKETCALEQNKKTNDVVSWDDVKPYLSNKHVPRCPDGGTYSLGRVGEPPACSLAPAFVGGKSHEISK
jgi:hypothetical protein